MGWANRITVARGVLTVALWLLLLARAPAPPEAVWWLAFAVFAVAGLSDIADGILARRFEEVSVFGRIADPVVDKLLILGTGVVLLGLEGMRDVLPVWALLVLLVRELLVTSLRAMVEGRGVSFQAVGIGKFKMLAQCIAVGAALLYGAGFAWARASVPVLSGAPGPAGPWSLAHLTVWIAVLITIVSGVSYVRRGAALLAS